MSTPRNAPGGKAEKRGAALLERGAELDRLDKLLDGARNGRGRLVALGAEAGAGKTSLIEHFVTTRREAMRLYWGACENLATPEVLLPLRDIVRSNDARDLKVDLLFSRNANHMRTFEAVLRLLAQGGAPAALVIEDIHWADTATLDLLRYLSRRVASAPALIIITYRDEELGARSPVRSVLGEAPSGVVERMTLAPLSLAAVTELAARNGRRGEELFALTAGNPFLVTEALAADGAAGAEGAKRFRAEIAPAAVRDATLARASRLSDEGRTLLEAVSIFPRRAETAMVAELVKERLDASLDECVEKGMLSLEGGHLQFRHELARRSIEASIARTRLRALHQRVVDVLRKRPDARASEVAHHAQRAGDVQASLEFARRAAEQATLAGAPREAVAHFAAMLEFRERLSAAALVETLEQHAEQSHLLGEAHSAMLSMSEAVALRRRENDVLKVGRDLTRLARYAWMRGQRNEAESFVAEAVAVLEGAPPGAELAWAYSHQSQLDMLASRMDDALSWGGRALELARRLNDAEIIVHALGNVGSAKAYRDAAGSCADLELSFESAVAGKYHDHVERALCNLTCTHYWRRDHAAALRYIDRGVTYARSLELDHWEGYLRGWRSMIRLDQGCWADAEEEALEITSRVYAADVYRFPALTTLARLRLRRGDPDWDAPLESARKLSASTHELQRSVYIALTAGESTWLQGTADSGARLEAVALLRTVHTLAEQLEARWAVDDTALWLYELGELPGGTAELQQGAATAKSESAFREHCQGRWQSAAEGWRALERPYEEALALSHGDEAAQCRALAIYDRLGAVPAAYNLRRSMRAAGMRAVPRGPIAPTRDNSAGLTRRQMQVLAFIAEGLSNPEIASRLCISAKTAEHHVAAIMARLEAPTRQDAAAVAQRRGLLAGGKG